VPILSRRIKEARHVLLAEKRRNFTDYLFENVKGRDHLENLDVKKRIKLKLILGNCDSVNWNEI
jgi:hypothetical protein